MASLLPDDVDDEVRGLDVDERNIEDLGNFREDEDEDGPQEAKPIFGSHQDAHLQH